MTADLTEEDTGLSYYQTVADTSEGNHLFSRSSAATELRSDHHTLASENFSFSSIPGSHHNDVEVLLQNALRRNCNSIRQQATPRTSDSNTAARELTGMIATDLEAHLLIAAKRKRDSINYRGLSYASGSRGKGRSNGPCGKGPDNEPWVERPANDPLDTWATDILEWTGFPVSTTSENSRHSHDSGLTVWDADQVVSCFESFVLFVAHHVKAGFTQRVANGSFKPENCRLILPFANTSTEAERAGFLSTDYVDSMDFAHVECGMFPLSNGVERQAAPPPYCVVADAVMARDNDSHDEAELRLATRTSALYFSQHNRRFAWGLTVSNRTIRSYVFGPDDIWASTEINITSANGRLALISLLVNWSLCSVDSLGLDPSIRYFVNRNVGDPYLEIDIHKVDESTGKVGYCTYYSKRYVGAADRLTGCHARYFAASTTPESMDRPTFLIKDVWTTLSSSSVSDTREISFLKALQDVFGGTDKFKDSFSHFVSIGPVYINRGGKPVLDSTATAFAGLPSAAQGETKDSSDNQGLSSSRVRQHRRTVSQWPGNMISAADNPSQVIIAIADAMVALNAAFVKCRILHGNLSNRAIQFQRMADGIRGVLAEFDYASYSGGSPNATRAEAPELMLFQPIRRLERLVEPEELMAPSQEYAQGPVTFFDDMESVLYTICVLGTFGINQAEWDAYPNRQAGHPRIKLWNSSDPVTATEQKRLHMDTAERFHFEIAERVAPGPLRNLAVEMHELLFLDPRCPGSLVKLGRCNPCDPRNPLVLHDPLV